MCFQEGPVSDIRNEESGIGKRVSEESIGARGLGWRRRRWSELGDEGCVLAPVPGLAGRTSGVSSGSGAEFRL